MATISNPYVDILGLAKSASRPNYYQLLAIEEREDDERKIKAAYYRSVAKVSIRQKGSAEEMCNVLLAELAEARDCLLDDSSREIYNARLDRKPGQRPTEKLSREERRAARVKKEVRRAASAETKRELPTEGTLFPVKNPQRSASPSETSDSPLTLQDEPILKRNHRAAKSPNQPNTTRVLPRSNASSGSATVRIDRTDLEAANAEPGFDDLFSADGSPAKARTDFLVDSARPRNFWTSFSPYLSPGEIVAKVFAEQSTTDLQQQLIDERQAGSLVVGNYLVESELTASPLVPIDAAMQVDGGMHQRAASWGTVYIASRLDTGDHVSLRMLPKNFANELDPLSKWIAKTSPWSNDSFAPSIDCGQDGNRTFIASEYFPGEDLCSIVGRNGALSTAQTLHVISSVADALGTALVNQVRHTELRPSKILIRPGGRVIVRELAIGNLVDARKRKQPKKGQIVPLLPPDHVQFFAPEHFSGLGKVSVRSEIYSLGCIAVYLLTGKPPFNYSDSSSIAEAHRTEGVCDRGGQHLGLPPSVQKLIAKMTAQDPKARFSSFEQLGQAIDSICRSANLSPSKLVASWANIHLLERAPSTTRNPISRIHPGRLIKLAATLVSLAVLLPIAAFVGARFFSGQSPTPASAGDEQNIRQSEPVVREPTIIHDSGDSFVPEVEAVDAFELE